MTALQIAKDQCCNYRNDVCTGVTIGDDLKPVRFRPGGLPCLLAENQRCSHFEQCVIGSTAGFDSPSYGLAFAEATRQYRLEHNIHRSQRQCPGCGRPLEPRHRYCPECAANRASETAKLRMRKKRESDVTS